MTDVKPCTRRYRKKFYVVEIPCFLVTSGLLLCLSKKYEKLLDGHDVYVDSKKYNKCRIMRNRFFDKGRTFTGGICKNTMNSKRQIKIIYFKKIDGDICYLLFKTKSEYLKYKLKS